MNSEFIGMVDYVPESVHDLLADDSELSNCHSSSRSHHPSWECFMADLEEHPEEQEGDAAAIQCTPAVVRAQATESSAQCLEQMLAW